MGAKSLIYLGMFIGASVGGWIPTLWDAGYFSVQSVIGSVLGGFLGIWAGFKLSKAIGG